LNTQLNTQLNTPNLALDFTLNPTPDPNDNQSQFAPKRTKKVSLIWTDLMEETLFNELHRQDRLGKRANTGFKSKAWVVVQDIVQAVYTGLVVIEIPQLKSKELNYKALYKD
jgi:hypothetical protein